MARKLDPEDFTLSDSPRLGPVPIQPALTMPRALLPDGSPDLSLFIFWPRDWRQLRHLQVGDVVTLHP